MDLKFIERLPTLEEYTRLRELAGWRKFDIQAAAESLPKSLYFICCEDRNELVAMGRVVGDSKLCFYIQDVIVKPSYQGKGIGRKIMEHSMDYISANACENSFIALLSAKGKEGFYAKFGFKNRPDEQYGMGMHILPVSRN